MHRWDRPIEEARRKAERKRKAEAAKRDRLGDLLVAIALVLGVVFLVVAVALTVHFAR